MTCKKQVEKMAEQAFYTSVEKIWEGSQDVPRFLGGGGGSVRMS